MTQTILITGASSGIGKITAKFFQAKGWNGIVTMRSPDKEEELTQLDNLLITRLGVTDEASITEAMKPGIAKRGRINVLLNIATPGRLRDRSMSLICKASAGSLISTSFIDNL